MKETSHKDSYPFKTWKSVVRSELEDSQFSDHQWPSFNMSPKLNGMLGGDLYHHSLWVPELFFCEIAHNQYFPLYYWERAFKSLNLTVLPIVGTVFNSDCNPSCQEARNLSLSHCTGCAPVPNQPVQRGFPSHQPHGWWKWLLWPGVQTWCPLLFLLLNVFFINMSFITYSHVGKSDGPGLPLFCVLSSSTSLISTKGSPCLLWLLLMLLLLRGHNPPSSWRALLRAGFLSWDPWETGSYSQVVWLDLFTHGKVMSKCITSHPET